MFAFVPKISLFLAGVGIYGGVKSVSSSIDPLKIAQVNSGKVQNCQFIPLSKTSNIPVEFNVTDKDYFSIFCEDETDNILPNTWIGFFPKSLFWIYGETTEGKRMDLRAEDDEDLEEDSSYKSTEDEGWLGIKFFSPELGRKNPLRAKLTYYSENSSWAEVKPISHSNKNIYLLLKLEDKEEEEPQEKHLPPPATKRVGVVRRTYQRRGIRLRRRPAPQPSRRSVK